MFTEAIKKEVNRFTRAYLGDESYKGHSGSTTVQVTIPKNSTVSLSELIANKALTHIDYQTGFEDTIYISNINQKNIYAVKVRFKWNNTYTVGFVRISQLMALLTSGPVFSNNEFMILASRGSTDYPSDLSIWIDDGELKLHNAATNYSIQIYELALFYYE